MNIAVYSGTIPSTTFIENLIRGLAATGNTVNLFGKKTAEVKYPGNVKIYNTPTSRFALVLFLLKESIYLLFNKRERFMQALKIVMAQSSLYEKLQKAGLLFPVLHHEPDVFHIQWAKTVQQHPELFKLLRCKFVLSLRGAQINYSPIADKNLAAAYRKNFPVINGFHAVSRAIGEEAAKYGADRHKTRVIYSPVMENVMKEFRLKLETSVPLKIVSIGRFHWKKGYDYALDAMAILRDKKLDFTYTIVAQGDIPEEILYQINDLDLNKNIKIIDGLKHAEVIRLVGEQDVFLLPSVEEGIANVALEAMAIGTPVVSTNCGGMQEVITDNENGFIVPIRNADAIANALLIVATLPTEKLSSITEKAWKIIKSRHAHSRKMHEFEVLYRDVILA